jgi:capsule polysaccharide modification protein KpsS
VRKNSRRKYLCTVCGQQALFALAAFSKTQTYAQAATRLLERVSQRASTYLTGISRPNIVKLARKRRPSSKCSTN